MQGGGDFRQLLRATYLERRAKNPAYSIRAFARSLGVNHGLVSLYLSNKRPITDRAVIRIGARLGLKKTELEQLARTSKPRAKPKASAIQKYAELSADQFMYLGSPKDDVLLELTRVKGFSTKPQWIAKRLGVSVVEAQDALDRLQRLGLLKFDAGGKLLEQAPHTSNIPENETTQNIQRNYQRQLLEAALKALEEVELEARSNTSMTLAMPASRVQEAKELIRNFRREFTALLQRPAAAGEDFDSVYQIAIAFYPVAGGNVSKKEEVI